MKFQLSTFISLLFLSTTASSMSPASPSRPHVIFVLFDDQGYNEVNWVNGNSKRYVLPTLDSLAADKVGKFWNIPYWRYTGILIGKMIVPVRQPKMRMSQVSCVIEIKLTVMKHMLYFYCQLRVVV